MKLRSFLIKAVLPILILVLAIGITSAWIRSQPQPAQIPRARLPMLVEVLSVEFRPHNYQIQSQGLVEPVISGAMVSEVSGRVIAMAEAFTVGGFVKKGEVLLEVDPLDHQTVVTQAQAQLLEAKSNLEEEKARGRVAEEQWRQVEQDKKPELGLRRPQLASAQAALHLAEAQLEQAKRNLARTHIRAPYDALIQSRQVVIGEYVTPGLVVAELLGTAQAQVRLPLTQSELALLDLPVHPNLPVTLTQEFTGQAQQRWKASLRRSEGRVDPQSRGFF